MKKGMSAVLLVFALFLIPTVYFIAANAPANKNPELMEIEKILSAQGQMDEGALVVKFPRNDLKVTVEGEAIPTAYGLVSWTAWKQKNDNVMVMGDLTLLEREVNPVISALEEANIEVTGLHNHFFNTEPRIMYMHIFGKGDYRKLAGGVKKALDITGMSVPVKLLNPAPMTVNTKRMEEIIGQKGVLGGGSFKITIGRKGVKMDGEDVTSSMGLNSWVAFIGSDSRAHVAGDIVMTAREVNKVIKELRGGNIEVVAVHNHMLDEQPRVFFLHYWGTGPAEELARTVKKAFDQASGPIQ